MVGVFRISDLTWSFLRAIVLWSLLIAVAVAVGSCVLVCNPGFTFTFVVAATFDVGTLALVMKHARTYVEHKGAQAGQRLAIWVGARLVLKAILLALAAFMPGVFDFLGMVLGVLLVDTTILVFGSVAAALKMPSMGSPAVQRKE